MKIVILVLAIGLIVGGLLIWNHDREQVQIESFSFDGKWIVQILKQRIPGSEMANITLCMRLADGSYLSKQPLMDARQDDIKDNSFSIKWLSDKTIWIASLWGNPANEGGYYQWQVAVGYGAPFDLFPMGYKYIMHERSIIPIPELIEYLNNKDKEICDQAEKSLIKITGQNFGRDYSKWDKWWRDGQDSLKENKRK